MSNINNIYVYYKTLDAYKKVYLQRGYWSRAARKNKLQEFYKKFGEHHSPSGLKIFKNK